MKKLITPFLIMFSAVCLGQFPKDTSYFDGCNWVRCKDGVCSSTLVSCLTIPETEDNGIFSIEYPDTLIASRFIEDSLGNTYEVEYKYSGADSIHKELKNTGEAKLNYYYDVHRHYISLVSIIKYKGNKKQTIISNYKSIYSPTECSSDSRELWLKRLYQFLNNKTTTK